MGSRFLDKISTEIQRLEHPVDRGVYATLIKRCSNAQALLPARQLHSHLASSPLFDDPFLINLLIQMYGKCGSLEEARLAFDDLLPQRNIFSWTIMVAAYAESGEYLEALRLIWSMDHEGIKSNGFILASIVSACPSLDDLKKLHSRILAFSLQDVVLETVLLNSYGRCGGVEEARGVFDSMPERNLMSWNAMIGVYAQHGHVREAFVIFHEMSLEGLQQNKVTLTHLISACSSPRDLKRAREVHSRVEDAGFDRDALVGNNLVSMFGKCRDVHTARDVFDAIPRKTRVSWTAMITAYAQNGQNRQAVDLFQEMNIDVLQPDKLMFIVVLEACAGVASLGERKKIHDKIIELRFESDELVLNGLMSMYWKCGELERAMEIFSSIDNPGVVSWNTMIAAFAQSSQSRRSIDMFHQMNLQGVKPDRITFMSVLEALSSAGALNRGKAMHDMIKEKSWENDIAVCNSLLNMYSKCGGMHEALMLFNSIVASSKPDEISWTSIISGYAQHGHSPEALELYQRMALEGVKPNQVTLLSILTACTRAGLVEDGVCYFASMASDHGIETRREHYSCLIDLLAVAGRTEEAEKLVERMPFEACGVVLTSLLRACCLHKDVDRVERVAGKVLEREPGEAGPYIILSNFYAREGRWDDVARIRKLVDECHVKQS